MSGGEQLLGRLAPRLDHRFDGRPMHRIGDLLDRVAEVARRMVHVDGVVGGAAALLVAEYEVDPVVEAARHVVALERLAHHVHEEARLVATPGGQHHVVDVVAVLACAEVEALPVGEELVEEEELGYELLVVRR